MRCLNRLLLLILSISVCSVAADAQGWKIKEFKVIHREPRDRNQPDEESVTTRLQDKVREWIDSIDDDSKARKLADQAWARLIERQLAAVARGVAAAARAGGIAPTAGRMKDQSSMG